MYSLSTYFYWLIIILIRIDIWFLYYSLRPFRGLINKLCAKQLKKYAINLITNEDKKLEDVEGNLNQMTKQVNFVMKDPNLLLNVICHGTMGLGEGYMKGTWDSEDIELMTKRIWEAFGHSANPIHKLRDWVYLNASETPWDDNANQNWITSNADKIMKKIMGEHGTFSSGYWDSPETVEDFEQSKTESPLAIALERNMEILADKLDLRPGMFVLDVGCGTGGFSKYISTHYDQVRVIGINNSKAEIELAKQDAGNVQFILGDYRKLLKEYEGKFHRVVCLHLIEHIGGPKNYQEFFKVLRQYLRPNDGKLVMQCALLTRPIPLRVDLFMRKYFVRHVISPYTSELLKKLLTGFHIDSVESTGTHYKRTLGEYRKNLENESSHRSGQLDDEYERVIHLSLRMMILGIDMRRVDVWQVVASKFGEIGK